MITELELVAGSTRLQNGKLTESDVDKLVSAFRTIFGGLESYYNYQYESKLQSLDDTANSKKQAAQVVACLIKMEILGFPVGSLTGKFGVIASQYDQFLSYALFAFSKIYPIPSEYSTFKIRQKNIFKRLREFGS